MQMTWLLHKKATRCTKASDGSLHIKNEKINKKPDCWSDRWFACRCAHGRITVQPCGDLGYIPDLNCFNTGTAPHFMDALYY